MKGALSELDFYKNISKSAEVFERQILAPVKFSAQLILEMRRQSRPTTDLQCMVFARSYGTYDHQQKAKMVTVSTICPKIGTTMNVRIREDQADKLDYGVYSFPNVQPVPLANRMKSFAGRGRKMEPTSVTPSLADCDFLFADLDDIEHFEYSFEMRHYCEVASSQVDKKQMLGAVLILSGKLVGTSPSSSLAIIRNPISGYEEKFYISDNKSGNIDDIYSLDGKFVRFLAAVWYNSGQEEEDYPGYPEIFCVEDGGTEADSVLHNVIGHARLRGSITKDDIVEMGSSFGNLPTSIFSFTDGGQTAIYTPKAQTNDHISTEFLNVVRNIAMLRKGASDSLLVTPDDFLNEKKLSVKMFSRKKYIAETLLKAISEQDSTEKGTVTYEPARYEDRATITRWIKKFHLGTIEPGKRNTKTIRLTSTGNDVAYAATKDIIARIIENHKADRFFSIDDIGKPQYDPYGVSVPIPISLFIRFLRDDPDMERVFQSLDYYWCRKDTDKTEVQNECENLAKSDFEETYGDILSTIPYDYVPEIADDICIRENQKLCEGLGCVRAVLAKNGEKRWNLPLEGRILFLLSSSGGSVSRDKALDAIIFPSRDPLSIAEKEAALSSAIDNLAEDGKISIRKDNASMLDLI